MKKSRKFLLSALFLLIAGVTIHLVQRRTEIE